MKKNDGIVTKNDGGRWELLRRNVRENICRYLRMKGEPLFSIPKNIGFMPFTSSTVTNLSSSPFKITCPVGFRKSKISVFAFKIPSLDFKNSKWHRPILVITQVSGFAIFAKRCISPKSLIPISSTAISCSCLSLKTVRGSPSSLLKFPWVFKVLYFRERTAAIISFVLVFPTLPVIPTTGMLSCSR